jgi:hypothetical protein
MRSERRGGVPVRVIAMVAETAAPVFQYPDQASIGDERRRHRAIDVDVDIASVPLELPGIDTVGGRQGDVASISLNHQR